MIRLLGYLTGLGLLALLAGVSGILWVFWKYGQDLPDYQQLADYDPPVMTRVHAGDGSLMAEYAIERRVFVPVQAMPRHVKEAFVSAEDKNFYTHIGIDPVGIVRAAITNLRNLGSRRAVGASTITQQVAKNFLLTNERSLERKIREAILAIRMERAYSKDRILELYLNEIYLGVGSYGVAAAAINYFDKSLDDLTLAEAAFLAGLPKAPANYHPVRRAEAARGRRNYVLRRLTEDGHVSAGEARRAAATEIRISPRNVTEFANAAYFAEEVRRQLGTMYGENGLYEGGLSVRTTLSPRLQGIIDAALRDGLLAYDRRHGWRGPVSQFDDFADWRQRLGEIVVPDAGRHWEAALVLEMDEQEVRVGFADGHQGTIPFAEMKWARPWLEGENVGPSPNIPSDVLSVGDVIVTEPILEGEDGESYPIGTYALRQIPEIQGGAVALDPHTGRVLAMTGGFDHSLSEFNRVTQANRQPGSAFKPFVYMAGLDSGYTPATLILDAPFVIDQGEGLGKWKPANYTRVFYGPSTMRLGMEKSRNLMTVRLAQTIGIDVVADYAERFGVVDHLPRQLSMSLGAGETTLMRMATAYAMIVNGGHRIEPTLIDRIQDREGRTVFKHDTRACDGCQADVWQGQGPPQLPDARERVVDPGTAYQMVSLLQGVVDRGTGRRVSEIGKPLAGKTGTTNDSFDSWFVGFSPDLVVAVYTGFDRPRSLGEKESGSSVAAPIFKQVMQEALAGETAIPFRVPAGLRLVRINAETGVVAAPGESNVILEAFKPGTVPEAAGPVLDGGYDAAASTNGSSSGIY